MKTAAAAPAKPRGRPRSFDREAALERAMQVFWKQGYEATSIHDLTRAMRINPPSLYAAFGDKERLFMEAVERYEHRRPGMAELLDQVATAKQAVERLLGEAASELASCGGCMLVLSAASCSEDAAQVQSGLAKSRAEQKASLKARIDRGIREGDVPRGTDSLALAEFYITVLHGMSIRARDGATRKSLRAAAEGAMRAWPSKRR